MCDKIKVIELIKDSIDCNLMDVHNISNLIYEYSLTVYNNNCNMNIKEIGGCCYVADKRKKFKKYIKRKQNNETLKSLPMFSTFYTYKDGIGNIQYENYCFKYYCIDCFNFWVDKCVCINKTYIMYRSGGYIGSFPILNNETYYEAYRRLKQSEPNAKASSPIYIPDLNEKKI